MPSEENAVLVSRECLQRPPFYVLVFIAGYVTYTLVVTNWRMKYRRAMNEMDGEANSKAIDSLLNYETVKYFGAEDHEAQRFDVAKRRYERAAVLTRTSLSLPLSHQSYQMPMPRLSRTVQPSTVPCAPDVALMPPEI